MIKMRCISGGHDIQLKVRVAQLTADLTQTEVKDYLASLGFAPGVCRDTSQLLDS